MRNPPASLVEAPAEIAAPEASRAAGGTTRRKAGAGGSFARFFLQEDLNFLLTNRIPRRLATRFMGWFSRIEVGWVRDASLWLWQRFAPDLDLSDAKPAAYRSLHDVFVRELVPGARPFVADPRLIASPCDAVVGACGRVRDAVAFQAKGFPYRLHDLLPDPELAEAHRDGVFVTLRLRSTMYHRFHAPCAARLRRVDYVSGDTWNVNPIALERVERLFCRNERAVLDLELDDPALRLTLVPVAAILVASLQLHALPAPLDLEYRGPNRIACDARYARGDELGFFQHGSTILVFASGGFELCPGIATGARVRAGMALLRRPAPEAAPRAGASH